MMRESSAVFHAPCGCFVISARIVRWMCPAPRLMPLKERIEVWRHFRIIHHTASQTGNRGHNSPRRGDLLDQFVACDEMMAPVGAPARVGPLTSRSRRFPFRTIAPRGSLFVGQHHPHHCACMHATIAHTVIDL